MVTPTVGRADGPTVRGRRKAVRAVLAVLAVAPAPAVLAAVAVAFSAVPLHAQDSSAVRVANDSVVIRMVDTDLRAAIQMLSRFLDKTVLTVGVPANRITLQPPGPVARDGVLPLFRGLVESQGLEFVEDSAYYRIRPKPPAVGPAPGGAAASKAQDDVRLFVIRLKHARAPDVAATVNQLFGGSGDLSGSSGLSRSTLSDELRRNVVPPQGAAGQANQPAGPAARPSALTGAVTIVPDQLTNALLIRASPADFETIQGAVDYLDIRPLQVLIEVLIVEVRKDRSFSLGADVSVPPQKLDGGTVDATLTGGGLGDLIIRLMNLGKGDIDATIRLAQSRGDAEIVSRPVLLASNNVEASFLVGSQRPFVQVSRSLPTDTPSRDQVVQYRDVGTKLTVLPTINQDGYVSLLLQQEINAATNETQFDAPVISTREARTQVLVRDGQTIVIGGLRDDQRDRSQSGVPILSGIPIIGGLFGGASRRQSATELYIFITPRIIRSDADASTVTEPRVSRMRVKP
ncbi:MAG: type II secretion system protein GspD [Gemmatimonadales bacterium]